MNKTTDNNTLAKRATVLSAFSLNYFKFMAALSTRRYRYLGLFSGAGFDQFWTRSFVDR